MISSSKNLRSINALKKVGFEEEGNFRDFYYDGIHIPSPLKIYTNGNVSASGKYDKGKRIGRWQDFHENGERKSEGSFEGMDFIGRWIFYSELGEILLEKDY